MKKLIVILSVVALAIGANAATVTWTMTNVKGPTGTANSGTAYMFAYLSSATDATTASTIAAAIQSAYKTDGNKSAGVTAYLSANSAYSWTPSTAGTYSDSSKDVDPVGDFGLTGGGKYNFYAVVFDTTEITDSSKFFVTQELANKTVPTGSSNLGLLFGSQAGNSAAANWTAVPEPTSGLLMLLGMAGLALKRKRA